MECRDTQGPTAQSILCGVPQSLTFLLVHVVFSTKDRLPVLAETVRAELFAYLATVARNAGCECYRVGGVADHVHLAVGLSRTVTIAALVEELKTSSSQWLKTQGLPAFAWQRGYGAFSVGRSEMERLLAYIDQQEAHHRRMEYREEFRLLLQRYGVKSDERYVWD